MIEPLKQHEFEKIRDLLESVCGIVLKPDQDYLVETRLTELANEIGAKDFGELHRYIISDESLLPKVVDLMTTNETLWFRDDSCWLTVESVILPELISKMENGQPKIRVWSAASSTGQEAYSLVMTIMEYLERHGKPEMAKRFEIVATDISSAAVYIARRGTYDPFTISRGMSDSRKQKYFEKEQHAWTLKDEIKERVEFRVFNLMDNFVSLGIFDLVFCRNVAIYFSEEFKKELFAKIGRILTPNGYMLLGASESLFGIKTDFENLSFGNGLYYRIRK